MIEELKSLPNILNILLFLMFSSILLKKMGKKKGANIITWLVVAIFILTSTQYLPRYIVGRMEASYAPFQATLLPNNYRPVYIHVLGAGYSLNSTFPANTQLDLLTLGRLVEGMRIAREVKNSRLVCSGYSSLGKESQASVVRRTAIALGFDSSRLETLTEPSTTLEEAKGLARCFGTDITVIVVTDALHMPRAIETFKGVGFRPFPAPTNYLIKSNSFNGVLTWMPALKNLVLSDRIFHEVLGYAKLRICQ